MKTPKTPRKPRAKRPCKTDKQRIKELEDRIDELERRPGPRPKKPDVRPWPKPGEWPEPWVPNTPYPEDEEPFIPSRPPYRPYRPFPGHPPWTLPPGTRPLRPYFYMGSPDIGFW